MEDREQSVSGALVLEPPPAKRQRCKSSDSDNSGPDEGEFELYTKYFATNEKKKKALRTQATNENLNISSIEKPNSRKRKFVYKAEDIAPKRSRKFFYLNEYMTKPRRPKTAPKLPDKKIDNTDKSENNILIRTPKLHFAKVDSRNGALCLMHRCHLKSDLFFNDEKQNNYEVLKKQDLMWNIVDEIALEGLDGITVEGFWKRLIVVFPNYFTKAIQDRIWRMICNNKRIGFYILNEPREKLVIFDRQEHVNRDSGIFAEPLLDVKELYPHGSVNNKDVRGSCSTFESRKENNGVRKFSMEKALKLYDQKLIWVADQPCRNKAIISEETDPNIELLDQEYSMLERIGRSRYQGEVTQGKMSLYSFYHDTKNLHHHTKCLMQNFLIANQFFYLRSQATQTTISGGILHLSRFFNKRKSKHVVMMEQIANVLKERPNFCMELEEFRKVFQSSRSLTKLFKFSDFKKFFKISDENYRKYYPNALKSEYMNKTGQKERNVRILSIIDPTANVTALLDANKESKEVPVEPTSDDVGHKFINYDYLHEVFLYILSNGKFGVTVQEIHDYFKMDFYSVRMAVKKLLLRNVIDSHKIDLGRQQSLKFFAKCLNIPNLHINTEPKKYALSEEAKSRILQVYDQKFEIPPNYYTPPDLPSSEDLALVETTHFNLKITPFPCPIFLTDSILEERTIMEIVLIGRDRLLLAGSNLEVHYENEFKDFLLKRDVFSKLVQLFQIGFGKLAYDFITSSGGCDNIKADNVVLFEANNLVPDANIGNLNTTQKVIHLDNNYVNPYSDTSFICLETKTYLFKAMLNESHSGSRTVHIMRDIFEQFMKLKGKKRKAKQTMPLPINKFEPRIQLEVHETLVLKKFMGQNPILEFVDESAEEGVKTEIFSSTKPEKFVEAQVYLNTDENFTQRYIDRANMILQIINDKAIVKNVSSLLRDIRNKEIKEGYDKTVCKKSINSILDKLVKEGYLRIIHIVMSGRNMSRTETFICLPQIDIYHPFIKSTVDQLKLKFYVSTVESAKSVKVKKKRLTSPFSASNVKESITELRQLSSSKTQVSFKFNKTIGKTYGYSPKFARMRILHEFLFYIIRDLKTGETQVENKEIFELCKKFNIKMSSTDVNNLPPVYCKEISWKMFIPPVPEGPYWPKGWILACDVTLRMPLSVFVKLYNVSYEIPELKHFLEHPVKRHYLLKHIPVNIRNALLFRRKYFFSIYESITTLCYVGLLQLGPRNFKDKDQVFIYLNHKASLYDTCSSKPGYNKIENKKYKKIHFTFNTGTDVEVYWSEMWRISMNTQLGKRKVLEGQVVTIEECASKPAMIESLKMRTFDQAVEDDVGRVPGDRRGAAGFDSSLWTFVKRNWLWSNQLEDSTNKSNTLDIRDVVGLNREKINAALVKPIKFDMISQKERKVYLKKPVTATKTAKNKISSTNLLRKKKIIKRIMKSRSRKRIREYHDALDKEIMKKNQHTRVDWDDEEDQWLRFCRAASVFLCPQSKKQFIPYNIIRDVLHRVYPLSKNKTARAIQRRIYILMMGDEITRIMENNIENFLNSETIAKYFEQIHNRYKKNIKISDGQVQTAFVYLMTYIFKHRKEIELLLLGYIATVDFFSDSYISLFEIILQNIEEESQTANTYPDPKTRRDIVKDTIKTVVHCSMSCKNKCPAWVFQLFHIYKKFPDELIRATVAEMKKCQFLVINRTHEEKTLADNWHTPIKLSHLYTSVMKSSTYSLVAFQESFKKFVELISGESRALSTGKYSESCFLTCNELISFWPQSNLIFEIPEMGLILNPDIEDHSEVINELSKRFLIYLQRIFEGSQDSSSKKDEEVILTEEKSMLSEDKKVRNITENKNVLEDIKNDVRRLIFSVPYLCEDSLEDYYKKLLESTTAIEINNYLHLMVVDLKKFALDNLAHLTVDDLKVFIEHVDDQDLNIDQDKLLKNLSKLVFAIQNIQQLTISQSDEDKSSSTVSDSYDEKFKKWELESLYDTANNVDHINSSLNKSKFGKSYNSGMENCIKRAKDGDLPSLEEIKEGIMTNEVGGNRKFPHITDLIMLLIVGRFPELDNDHETIERMKNHFITQYPNLQDLVIEDLDELKQSDFMIHLLNQSKIEEVKQGVVSYTIRKPPQMDIIQEFVAQREIEDEILEFMDTLIEYIRGKEEFGASAQELKTKFGPNEGIDLPKLLGFLSDNFVILRTGVNYFVYVHHEYEVEWLTAACLLTQEETNMLELTDKQEIKKVKGVIAQRLKTADPYRVQLKPWTKLDGNLNEDSFHEWLCILLSHCLNFPNIPFTSLCDQFSYVKPVDIFSLLEALQELCCVEICRFPKKSENNIFAPRVILEDESATCLDSFQDIFVKTCNVSGLCFGSFLDDTLDLTVL